MINRLLQFSLHNRWLMLIMSFALMGIGYFCFTQLKIEAYPDIADTNVIIVAKYDGRASEEVEQQVTRSTQSNNLRIIRSPTDF